MHHHHRLYLLAVLATLFVAASEGYVLLKPQNDLPNTLPNHLHAVFSPSTNLSDIRYLLWTRSNPQDDAHYRLMPGDLTNLKASPLVPSLPTYVMYHGFNDDGLADWITQSKTGYLELQECNVISVDWQKLVPSPWYETAVDNAYRTANYTASLLDWMAQEVGLRPEDLHIIGHSLGGQAAGLTAQYVTTGMVSRVTGLDPAGPLFYDVPPEQRIDSTDAQFVDIIHTNSGSILEGCAGLFKNLGHVDFYPNGGKHQPGCLVRENDIFFDWSDTFGCSHARATKVWVESISSRKASHLAFTAWPCSDWDSFMAGNCTECGVGCVDMGFYVPPGTEGTYILRTNPTSPFALGDTQ